MNKILSILLAGAAIALTGCGMLKPGPKTNGYYSYHLNSCGPVAISKALTKLDKKQGPLASDISIQIQDNGNFWRHLMVIAHRDAGLITCPHEVIEVCKQNGYEVLPVADYAQLDPKKDVALILLYSNMLEWHWVCFPVDKNIPNWYGDNTKIVKIFLLKKQTS
ncbi:hypothetical protein H8E06_00350 [bacterium]|nr:hypothetical protein [bacterium]